MILRLFLLFTAFLALPLASFAQKITAEEYIATYKDLAIKEMHRARIPASITLAQGLLESGYGNSYLAREANNHFGIKCKSDWTGKSVKADDDALQECFRAYDNVEDSYRDHSDFLVNGPRYQFLFKLDINDYKGWANGLKEAGYATNPKYADLLIGLIEKYELFNYGKSKGAIADKGSNDNDVHEPAEAVPGPAEHNGIPIHVVKKGDDIESIARSRELMPWEVRKYNDLEKDEDLLPGTILYLKPKHRKGKVDYHIVQEGENMYYISQLHAVKLKFLYKMNLMASGEEPVSGEKVYLRKKQDAPPKLKASGSISPVKTPLMVPNEKPVKVAEKKPQPKPAIPVPAPAAETMTSETEQVRITQAETEVPLSVNNNIHVVRAGETLYGISRNYTIPVDSLVKWNKLSTQVLSTGQRLVVTPPAEEPNQATALTQHTVKAGETLYSIARKHNCTVAQLRKWNNLSSEQISTGQILIVGKQ
ncbi:MAG: LysM peptidoglycan-binding domain-containing protein [Bacteroidota bacterium]|nr:LysM peptidoglycan-binding domain-containing protein [Bacteroidota bacterium]